MSPGGVFTSLFASFSVADGPLCMWGPGFLGGGFCHTDYVKHDESTWRAHFGVLRRTCIATVAPPFGGRSLGERGSAYGPKYSG